MYNDNEPEKIGWFARQHNLHFLIAIAIVAFAMFGFVSLMLDIWTVVRP